MTPRSKRYFAKKAIPKALVKHLHALWDWQNSLYNSIAQPPQSDTSELVEKGFIFNPNQFN